jgi:hypothetical protein
MKWHQRTWLPALVTLLITGLIVAVVILDAGGDPLALARLGTRFNAGDPEGTDGYDGQFVYYIARDWRPERVAPHLDVPAYRYQRILLPLLARLFSGGNTGLIPWLLPLLGLLSHALGTWLVAILLQKWNISPWYALVYGLWVGFVLAIRLDLPEPLAYAFVVASIWALTKERHPLAWLFLGLSLFAKEVTMLFVGALGLTYLLRAQWRRAFGLGLVALLPFAIFQVWLWRTFGAFGVGSGGDMATPFEFIPLMGILRIGYYSPVLLLATIVVSGPFLILPTIWSIVVVVKRLFREKIDFLSLALGAQAISILFLPFSTYREPGGLLRYACGLIPAVLLFAAKYNHRRVLRYAPLWVVLNVFLLKGQ